jgi:hypothetical protein
VADTLVKPIELAMPAGEVAQRPSKPTIQPVQRRIVGPLRLPPSLRISPARPVLVVKPDIATELAEIRKAWRIYRSTNSRDAVYIYLAKVFAVVSRWQRLDCALKNARAALRLQPNAPQMNPEPFATVIFCSSDANVLDAKTRSKWSRSLRYAVRAKPPGQHLADFVRACGGLNECSSKFARIVE